MYGVQILNSDFKYCGAIGRHGSSKGEFVTPYGIASVSVGNVYVVDHDSHGIQVFTANGKFLRLQ